MAIIDITPLPSMFGSIANREKMTLRETLSELVDNAFDQNANRIEITTIPNGLVVEDNGLGIADWKHLLVYGGHHKIKQRTVGRYGVGFKQAAIWLAESVDIETRHDNARSFSRISWASIEEYGWKCEVGDLHSDPGPSYTRFEFHGIRNKRLKKLSQAAKALAYRFTPALKRGAEIIVDGEHLVPTELPPFANEPLIFEGYFQETKHYRITAGVKADHSEPERKGYDIAYMHLIIREHDMTGTKDLSGQRFYAYLELLTDGEEDWTVSEHKEDFAEREDLFDDLFDSIEDIVKAAAAAKERMEFKDCQRIVIENIKRAVMVKERRDPGKEKGTHSSNGRGGPRKFTKVQPTPEAEKKPKRYTPTGAGGVQVTFDCQVPDQIGDVQTSRYAVTVALNPNYEVVRSKNPEAITAVVCALLVFDRDWRTKNRQQFFPDLEPDDYENGISDLSELLSKAVSYEKTAAAAKAKAS